MNIADGFNFWIGHELIPFLIMGGIVLFGYGVIYLLIGRPPRKKK